MNIEFWFVRHGESEVNASHEKYKNIYCGRNAWSELTSKGVAQAKAFGRYFKDVEFAEVFSSEAVRAEQSARYCLNAMGNDFPIFTPVPELNELDQGGLEGKVKSDSGPQDGNYWTHIPEGGEESQEMVYERVESWINKLLEGYDDNDVYRILIFSHENAIGCFRAGILGLDKDEAYGMGLKNTGANILQYNSLDEKPWSEIEKCHCPHLIQE